MSNDKNSIIMALTILFLLLRISINSNGELMFFAKVLHFSVIRSLPTKNSFEHAIVLQCSITQSTRPSPPSVGPEVPHVLRIKHCLEPWIR